MFKKELLIICFLALIADIKLFAQKDSSKIEFDASIRERFELWDGMNAKNYGDNSPAAIGSLHDKTFYQRVIVGFVLHPTASIDIAVHLQDSRAFGWSLRNAKYPDLFKVRENNTEKPYYIRNPNEEFFEIHDLFFEYKKLFVKNLTVKAGRQKINFGDNRIFGPGQWGNTGNWTWDALKLKYVKNDNYISAFIGGTIIHDPKKTSIPFTNTEFWGGGMYAHYNFPDIINVQPFYAYKTVGSADYINTLNFDRHWAGMRLFNPDFYSFEFDFTVAKEFGNENGQPIDAFSYVVKTGYQFKSLFSKPKLSLHKSHASGGNTGNKVKTFDPAYGSRDSYYGRMNIVKWSNIDDYEILLDMFPVKNMKIEMNYHWFYVPVPDDITLLGTMKLQTGKHHLGNEFDIFASYQVLKQLQIVTVFGYFMPGDIQPINNHDAKNATWFSFQLLYKLNNQIWETKKHETLTIYKNNSRFSSELKGCSPLQLSCKLTSKCYAVGYYSYTNRYT